MYFYGPLILTKTLKTLQLSPLLRICSCFYFFLWNTQKPLRFISHNRRILSSCSPDNDSLEILGVNCHISAGDAYKMHSFLSFYIYLFIQISCNNKEELKQHVVQTDLNNILFLIGCLRPTSSSYWSLQTSLQALATNWFIVLRGCILLVQCSDVLLYTGLHKMIFKHLKGVLEL